MGELRQFTPKQYEEYLNAELWELDGFDSEEAYTAHHTQTISQWRKQSEARFSDVKEMWRRDYEYLEKTRGSTSSHRAVAKARIPYGKSDVMEMVSLLFGNYPRPIYVSPQDATDKLVAVLNTLRDIELKRNDFDTLSLALGYDAVVCNFACLKQAVDPNTPGLFGQDDSIVMTQLDPMGCYPDPKARRLDWKSMAYFIYEEQLDKGIVMDMFPDQARAISDAKFSGRASRPDEDGMYGSMIKSPVPNPGKSGVASQRRQLRTTECWFKDTRLKFVGEQRQYENFPSKTVDSAILGKLEVANEDYDPDKPDYYMDWDVDEDGYVKGSWERAYPNGRCIVIVEDALIVLDLANPYWHGEAPYTFFQLRPSKELLTVGIAHDIITLDIKANDTMMALHKASQDEIERPVIADVGAFPTTRSMWRISDKSDNIVLKNPGKEVGRMEGKEMPRFVFDFLGLVMAAFDRVKGTSAVQRGDLSDGAQLSAEAVSSLQGFASSRLKMMATHIATSMKKAGFQLMWNIRETHDEIELTIEVPLPDGTTEEVEWDQKDLKDTYLTEIESGSGLPGADNVGKQEAVMLHEMGCVDDQFVLERYRIPGFMNILQRMRVERKEKIEAEAAGRAMGVRIKQHEKQDEKQGRRALSMPAGG